MKEKISDFLKTDYKQFAMYDSYRKIANYIDGLKPSARKILFCVDKLDITAKKIKKVSDLASLVCVETQFLHAQTSLEGVIVGLAQDFAGTNNINFLLPKGSFGTRSVKSPSASRYIFTCKNPVFDLFFNPDDKLILKNQEFEGHSIECQYFVPVLPVLLINGSEGIGNGFAQKILPRNPIEIIQIIENYLDTDVLPTSIKPFFKNFHGKIESEGSSHRIFGKFDRISSTVIEISEIPLNYDLDTYINVLDNLEEDKEILNYEDHSDGDNKFLFKLKVTKEFSSRDDDWIYNKLKLSRGVGENFTCIDENNSIVEFDNEIDVLKSFIKIRLEYYQKRKDFLFEAGNKKLRMQSAKYAFIALILAGKIEVFKKKREEIIIQLQNAKEYNFQPIDNSFNFLLSMPIHSFTTETIQELKKQIEETTKEISKIENTNIKDFWKQDIKKIKENINAIV